MSCALCMGGIVLPRAKRFTSGFAYSTIRKLGLWALFPLFLMAACTSATGATPTVTATFASTFTIPITPSLTFNATATLALPPSSTVTKPPATATALPLPGPFSPTPNRIQVGTQEQQVIDLVNQFRLQNDLAALTVDSRLMAAAEAHSLDMAQHNFFAHEGSDGSTVGDRLTRQGYGWSFYAENLACGYDSPGAAVQGWLASPAHRTNLLAAEAHQIGVGYAPGAQGSNCRTYWTADFAASH